MAGGWNKGWNGTTVILVNKVINAKSDNIRLIVIKTSLISIYTGIMMMALFVSGLMYYPVIH